MWSHEVLYDSASSCGFRVPCLWDDPSSSVAVPGWGQPGRHGGAVRCRVRCDFQGPYNDWEVSLPWYHDSFAFSRGFLWKRHCFGFLFRVMYSVDISPESYIVIIYKLISTCDLTGRRVAQGRRGQPRKRASPRRPWAGKIKVPISLYCMESQLQMETQSGHLLPS